MQQPSHSRAGLGKVLDSALDLARDRLIQRRTVSWAAPARRASFQPIGAVSLRRGQPLRFSCRQLFLFVLGLVIHFRGKQLPLGKLT